MPTNDQMVARIDTLEDLLSQLVGLFCFQPEGNSTFEGGRTLLDVEVSDETEWLLGECERTIETSAFEPCEEVEE